ncbi:hypothetical protein CCYA_CCYA07G2000 [Cyanidiococcus yangmingshanensis]|nr:hypothetical protein CCYA_CCYA07G2000 [Cyanidiococcus yangmingshanensis]
MWLRGAISLPRSVYIHIPFCRRRCHYCDFAILPVGNSPRIVSSRLEERRGRAPLNRTGPSGQEATTEQPIRTLDELYVDTVLRELSETLQRLPGQPSTLPPLDTVYIGGGTPSLLSMDQLERLLKALPRTAMTEVTLEMDPGTFDQSRVRQYRELGITRASVGVQALSDEVLAACGRSHTTSDIEKAIDALHRGGFGEAYSLDLICGLPNLTMPAWRRTLATIGSWQPPHVSIYDLSIESGTRFAQWLQQGRLVLPPEDTAADMLREAMVTLGTHYGYDHYEVSNYARHPSLRSRHNQVYWQGGEYWGFGLSASSYIHGKRFDRPRRFADYIAWVLEGCLPSDETPGDTLDEWLMLRLRTREGLSMMAIEQRFGSTCRQRLQRAAERFIQSGHMSYTNEAEGIHLRATDPDGWLILSHVVLELIVAIERAQDDHPSPSLYSGVEPTTDSRPVDPTAQAVA